MLNEKIFNQELKLQILKLNKIDKCALIRTKCGLKIWVDYWVEPEFTLDWNKYIFDLNNNEDLEIKAFQENVENYMEVFELVENILLRTTKEKNYVKRKNI